MIKKMEQQQPKHEKPLRSRERRRKLSWFQRSVVTTTTDAAGSDNSKPDPSCTSQALSDVVRPSVDVDAASEHFHPPQNILEDSHTAPSSTIQLEGEMDENSYSCSIKSNATKPLNLESSHNFTKSDIVETLVDVMKDDSLSDVTLLGRDGVRVRATRYILACQSSALHAILYQEPSESEVFIGDFGEEPICALKQYCVIGSMHRSPLMQTVSPEIFLGLVEVAALATIYGFDDLYADVDVYLNELIDMAPSLITKAYDEANLDTPLVAKLLVKFIRERSPQLLLETGALKSLGAQRMQDLLNSLMGTDGTRTFQYLKRWIDEHGGTEENMSFAKEFASRMFCLKSLLRDPKLTPSLKESGFFDPECIKTLLTNSGSPQSREAPLDQQEQRTTTTTFPTSPVTAPQPTSPKTPIQEPTTASHTTPTSNASSSTPDSSPSEGVTSPTEEAERPTSESNDSEQYLDGLVYQLLFDGSVLVHTLETIESFEY